MNVRQRHCGGVERSLMALIVAVTSIAACSGSGDTSSATETTTTTAAVSTTETTLLPEVAEALENYEVVAGRNGWLFFGDDIDPDCRALASLTGLERLGAGTDRLRYFVNEPASAFYPDELVATDQPDACVGQTRELLRRRFADDPLAMPVDDALRNLRDSGTDVFLRTDTHWSPEARIVVAQQVVDAIAPGMWDPSAVVPGDIPRTNDLGAFRDIEEPTTVPGPTVERDGVTVEERQVVDLFGPDFITRWQSSSTAETVVPGVTLIVGDSQMTYVVPEIASYFEHLVFINWFVTDLDITTFPTVPDPDRMIVQSVERYAVERFEHAALDGLAARLPG